MTAWTLLYCRTGRALAMPLSVSITELTAEQADHFRAPGDPSRANFILYQTKVDTNLQDDGSFREAVELGAGISHKILQYWGVAQDDHGLYVRMTLDLANHGMPPRGSIMSGASAGLLSALVLAEGCIKKWHRREVPFSYAATGEIDAEGTVGGVAHIAEKLPEALETLTTGSRVFYPHVNAAQLTAQHREVVRTKDIQLLPINTIAEALIHFLDFEVHVEWPCSSGLEGMGIRIVYGQALTLRGTIPSWMGAISAHALVWTHGERRLGTGPILSWTPEETGRHTIELRLAFSLDQRTIAGDCSVQTITVDVVQEERLQVSIGTPHPRIRIPLGTSLELQGTAVSNWHGALDGHTLEWMSDMEEEQVLGFGQTVLWLPRKLGHHTITLRGTSPSGAYRIATTVVDVVKKRQGVGNRLWPWLQGMVQHRFLQYVWRSLVGVLIACLGIYFLYWIFFDAKYAFPLIEVKPEDSRIEMTHAQAEYTSILKVKPGMYDVTISHNYYETKRLQIPVGKDQPSRYVVQLERKKLIENSLGMPFVLIPDGECEMGSRDEFEAERPVHRVGFSALYMAVYEVTQGQWRELMGENPPSKFAGDNRPVDSVSWDLAQKFISRLNKKEGGDIYRLPTEAEWECAARAGTDTKYSFGNDPTQLPVYAWFDTNAGGETHPVGTRQPNAWGLYDMYGNVGEWVSDYYKPRYELPDPPVLILRDPTGPSSGKDRVRRGGGIQNSAGDCRSARRYYDAPAEGSEYVGFRVVRTLP